MHLTSWPCTYVCVSQDVTQTSDGDSLFFPPAFIPVILTMHCYLHFAFSLLSRVEGEYLSSELLRSVSVCPAAVWTSDDFLMPWSLCYWLFNDKMIMMHLRNIEWPWTGNESVLHEFVPLCLIIIHDVWALRLSTLQMKTEAKRGSLYFQESSRADTLCLMSHCFSDFALLALYHFFKALLKVLKMSNEKDVNNDCWKTHWVFIIICIF